MESTWKKTMEQRNTLKSCNEAVEGRWQEERKRGRKEGRKKGRKKGKKERKCLNLTNCLVLTSALTPVTLEAAVKHPTTFCPWTLMDFVV